MQLLQTLLHKVQVLDTVGPLDVPVESITFDSRQVREGVLFVAVRGVQADGHAYMAKAADAKAVTPPKAARCLARYLTIWQRPSKKNGVSVIRAAK